MTRKAIYKRYVKHMWEKYGPMQGNPPTYTEEDFWKMVKSNTYFAKAFTGPKVIDNN